MVLTDGPGWGDQTNPTRSAALLDADFPDEPELREPDGRTGTVAFQSDLPRLGPSQGIDPSESFARILSGVGMHVVVVREIERH